MTISSTAPYSQIQAQTATNGVGSAANSETREQFDKFVGGTFFRQMLSEMQKSVGKSEYFHGGQAEEMFRSELNSHLADEMAASSAHSFSGPMFELFSLQRA
ncbi:MAG: rod-binding protein [Pirellulales bacterium]